VYGSEVGVGDSAGEGGHQHRGYGRQLIARAEELAADAGYEKLAVLSGIGVRQYYREKLGYRQDGPYVSKRL
jgi:elongator complex protein 3